MFPTKGVHDDMVDAVADIAQMSVTTYASDEDEEEYEPLDLISGI